MRQHPILFLVLLWNTATACQVWNADGVEVTSDFVVEKDALADCQGDNQCKDFRISNCDKVICWGLEACTRVQITNVTSSVSCEGTHSCHRTEVLGLLDAQNKPKVECIGDGACDVAVLEGLEEVDCLGFKACRKAHIKANNIKCSGGQQRYNACDLVYFHTHCLYCGVHGCHHNSCHVKVLGGDVMALDPDDEDPMTYEGCALESLTGECPEKWASELDYEKEVEYGTDENENGGRR
jgi:hypothetical protein